MTKNAFIPSSLRPNVRGATFAVGDVSYAYEVVNNIKSINEILNLSLRRRIIAKLIKNIIDVDCEDKITDSSLKTIKLMQSMLLPVLNN